MTRIAIKVVPLTSAESAELEKRHQSWTELLDQAEQAKRQFETQVQHLGDKYKLEGPIEVSEDRRYLIVF